MLTFEVFLLVPGQVCTRDISIIIIQCEDLCDWNE